MQLPGLYIFSHLYIIQLPFRNSSSFRRPRAVAAPTTSLGPNWSKWFGKYLDKADVLQTAQHWEHVWHQFHRSVHMKSVFDCQQQGYDGGTLRIRVWYCSQGPRYFSYPCKEYHLGLAGQSLQHRWTTSPRMRTRQKLHKVHRSANLDVTWNGTDSISYKWEYPSIEDKYHVQYQYSIWSFILLLGSVWDGLGVIKSLRVHTQASQGIQRIGCILGTALAQQPVSRKDMVGLGVCQKNLSDKLTSFEELQVVQQMFPGCSNIALCKTCH